MVEIEPVFLEKGSKCFRWTDIWTDGHWTDYGDQKRLIELSAQKLSAQRS